MKSAFQFGFVAPRKEGEIRGEDRWRTGPLRRRWLAGESHHHATLAIAAYGFLMAQKLKAGSPVSRKEKLHRTPNATFEEAGYKGLLATERFGVFLRRGTAPVLVERVNQEVNRALRQEDFRATLAKLSYEPLATTPQEFQTIIKAESARWGGIVKASGFSEE
jgi:tripartite-type tricarboxylate transporter receptor subunit TctC